MTRAPVSDADREYVRGLEAASTYLRMVGHYALATAIESLPLPVGPWTPGTYLVWGEGPDTRMGYVEGGERPMVAVSTPDAGAILTRAKQARLTSAYMTRDVTEARAEYARRRVVGGAE